MTEDTLELLNAVMDLGGQTVEKLVTYTYFHALTYFSFNLFIFITATIVATCALIKAVRYEKLYSYDDGEAVRYFVGAFFALISLCSLWGIVEATIAVQNPLGYVIHEALTK